MSYILDAIRKSEQQRQPGVGGSFHTVQLSPYAENQSSLLRYGIVSSILICTGILIGWWRPWQVANTPPEIKLVSPMRHEVQPPHVAMPQTQPLASAPVVVAEQQAVPQAPTIAPPHVPEVQKLEKPMAPTPLTTLKSEAPIRSEAPVKSEAPIKRTAPDTQPIAASKATPKELPAQPANVVAPPVVTKPASPLPEPSIDSGQKETAPEHKIVSLFELPSSVQQEIPKLTISGYAYSSVPKERSVAINDRLLQEGEYLNQDIRLERINPDSLVLSYKKYLFRLSLP